LKSDLDFEKIINEELESINDMIKDVSVIGSKKARQLLVVLYEVKNVLMNNDSSRECVDLILLNLPLLYIQKKELSKA